MTHTRIGDVRAALGAVSGAVLLALTMHGCTEASSASAPSSEAVPSTPIARPVAFAASMAQSAGFTFEDSRQDGDALVLTNVRYALDERTSVTAERLRVEAPGTGADGAVTARRVTASGIVVTTAEVSSEAAPDGALRVNAPSVTRIASLTIEAPAYAGRAELPADASAAERRRVAAARLGAVSFGALRAEGIAFENEAGTAGTVAAVTAAGYEDARLGRIEVTDIDLVAPDGQEGLREALSAAPGLAAFADGPLGRMLMTSAERTGIARVAWDGLDLSGPREALAAGRAPGLEADDIVFGDLVIEGQESLVGGAVAQRVAETRIADVRFEGVVPTAATVTTEGSVTDMTAYAAAAGEDAVALIEARGLDGAEGRSEAELRYDPEAGRLTATSDAVLDGLYAMRMQVDIGGLSEIVGDLIAGDDAGESGEAGADADLTEEIEAFGAFGDEVRLNALTVSVTDEQLLDVGFALAALGSDQSAVALRQQAVGMVTLGALQGGALSPRVPDYAAAISSFLSEGGTLTIRMAPEGGLTAARAQAALSASPAGILDAADLTITRTP